MKKLQLIILMSLISMVAKAQVFADFTAITSGCNSPWVVTLTDISTSPGANITSWFWDFGDGTTSTQQFPVHTYPFDGNFEICLTATNANGENDTECKLFDFIEVIAYAETPPMNLSCIQPDMQLDGAGSSEGPNYVYNWTTSNGNIVSGAGTLYPLVDAAGTYEIIVTDVFTSCTATASTVVQSDIELPTVVISAPPILSCTNASVIIDAVGSSTGPNFIYEWFFNGTPISTNPTVEVTAPGVFTLVITDTSNGCSASASVTIEEDLAVPVAIAGPNQTLTCTNPSVTLDGSGSSVGTNFSYAWLDGFSIISTAISVEVTQPGLYELVVTDDNNGCSATSQVAVFEDPGTLPTIVVPTVLTCPGELVGLQFDPPCPSCTFTVTDAMGVLICDNSTTCLIDPFDGPFNVTITDNNTGCSDTQPLNLTTPQPIEITSDVTNTSCFGSNDGAIDISVSGGALPYTYFWNPGAQITEDISNLSAGTYEVIVTDANGCIETHIVIVEQPIDLVIELFPSNPSCNGTNDGLIEYSVSGGTAPYTFDWSNGFSTSGFAITDLGVGTYTVTVTDANACTVTGEATLTPQASIVTTTSGDVTICQGDMTQLSVSTNGNNSPYTYQWSPPIGLSDPSIPNPIASPIETTTYTLTITDINGCSDYVDITIEVQNYLDFGLLMFSNSPLCEGENLELYSNLGTSFQWVGPNGFTSTIANPIVANAQAAMSGQYSITITDNFGCTATADFPVFIDDDCVWPGDADTNKVVNNFDLLNIGLAYDSVGPARNNSSISWIAHPAENWSQNTPTTNVNLKHADTDGNGIVNADDTLAIITNWGLTHNFNGTVTLNQFTDLPIATDGSSANAPFYVQPDSLPEGETIGLDIILGDMTNVVTGLYGIAFSIEYDTAVVVAGSASIDFSNSWLGDVNASAIAIQKDFPEEGRIDAAITRIDGIEMDGAGFFGEFIITIEDDILYWDPKNEIENDVFADFSITNFQLINFSQEEIIAESTTTTAQVIDDMSTSTHNAYLDKQIQLYPNPANEMIFISSKDILIEKINIYSTTSFVKAIETKTINVIEIPTMDLPNGIYFVELQTEKGIITKKLSIVK